MYLITIGSSDFEAKARIYFTYIDKNDFIQNISIASYWFLLSFCERMDSQAKKN